MYFLLLLPSLIPSLKEKPSEALTKGFMLQSYKRKKLTCCQFFFSLNKHHLGSVISSSKAHVKHLNSFFLWDLPKHL